MKNYLLKGGVTGFVVTLVALIIVELLTVCQGNGCNTGFWTRLPDRAFLADFLMINMAFLIGGIILGVILGYIISKIKSK